MNGLVNLTSIITTHPEWIILPEVLLLILLGLVLIIDSFLSDRKRWVTEAITLVGLLLIGAVQFSITLNQIATGMVIHAFNGMVVNDALANCTKIIMYLVVIFVIIYARRYLKQQNIYKGEFYSLILFALLGMSVMASSTNFLLIYIGLELMSLALYALIALRKHSSISSEAALKYFVLGSLASGILLYGISMIYGATGSIDMTAVANIIAAGNANATLLLLGLVFLVVGIAFKFGAVPFHMWVPDVYEGAPTSVAAFIGSAPKIAVVVFAYRILAESMGSYLDDWSSMLQIIAVASIFLGNLAAIMQTNVKRMLAYSTISHMGFVLLGLSANSSQTGSMEGFYSAMYYAITYVLMSLVAFGVLLSLSTKDKECDSLSDLEGLNKTHPLQAFLMLLAMFSMAGIPPLMGFYAKFYVIHALIAQGLVGLSIFAVIMSLIGAFYYLRVVKVMYFDAPQQDAKPLDFSWFAKILLVVNAAALLIFGMCPELILEICGKMFH